MTAMCISSKDELFAIASGLEPGAFVKLVANSHSLFTLVEFATTVCKPELPSLANANVMSLELISEILYLLVSLPKVIISPTTNAAPLAPVIDVSFNAIAPSLTVVAADCENAPALAQTDTFKPVSYTHLTLPTTCTV